MGTYGGPNIVTDGLVFSVDAANKKSYPGSGTSITDLSGNGNTGTLTNGPTFDGGNIGSINFDGSNDFVTFGTSFGNFGTDNFNVSLWIKTTQNNNAYSGVIAKFASNAGLWIQLNPITKNVWFGWHGSTYLTSTASVNNGEWRQISCQRTGDTTAQIYVDGVLVSSGAGRTGTSNSNATFDIGRINISGRYYSGKTAAVTFYNRALTAAEVFQNFTANRRRFSIPISHMVATGGTITTIGDYKIHTFTSSGTFEVTSGDNVNGTVVEYLIVAGGGGGGTLLGSGGGAGGLLQSSRHFVSMGEHTVTIGAGGAGATVERQRGASGNNSVFSSITATGGGGGGANAAGQRDGGAGGSGGGASYNGTAGAGTAGQGNNGGVGRTSSNFNQAGGGGAGAVGGNGTSSPNVAGDGGIGLQSSISGTNTYYAGGGGGSAYVTDNGTPGDGGLGGGGDGGVVAGSNASANTGGGGGGADRTAGSTPAGGNGGSGIIIIKYKFQ